MNGTPKRPERCRVAKSHRRHRPPSRRLAPSDKDDDDETRFEHASMVLEHFRSFRHSRSLDSISEDDERKCNETDFLRFFTVDATGRDRNEHMSESCSSTSTSSSSIMRRSQTVSCLQSLGDVDMDVTSRFHENAYGCQSTNGSNVRNNREDHGFISHHESRIAVVPLSEQRNNLSTFDDDDPDIWGYRAVEGGHDRHFSRSPSNSTTIIPRSQRQA